MKEETIISLVNAQRAFYHSGITKSLDWRRQQLNALLKMLRENEEQIVEALHLDMGKPLFEAEFSEVQVLFHEVDTVLKNVYAWMQPEAAATPLLHFPGSSMVVKEPFGIVLIMAPWNYPFQLLIAPLIGALAAGNTAILKPSSVTVHTSNIIAQLIPKYFKPECVSVVECSGDEANILLRQKYDYIFYTGSAHAGRIVMEAAAKHLTPVTLELGGKSPCIVDKHTNIRQTATKICWGKFFNAGQTCIAPDYILVHVDIKEALLDEMKKVLIGFYGTEPSQSNSYARICNEKHFDRLVTLLDEGNIIAGGQHRRTEKYIAPTIIDNISWESAIMADEIFGPIMPVIAYSDLDDILQKINARPKPLALYIFSRSRTFKNKVISGTSSGGVCVNDTLSHFTTNLLPFGGVGESGMGQYHGKFSFNAFSHAKPVLSKSFLFDVPLRYPPYRKIGGLMKKIIRSIS
jgi:aldehyde dehydrogenase (NAD+)